MFIAGFPAGPWQTNCYVVAAGKGEPCVVVDPGQGVMGGVREIVEANGLLPVAVLLTHGHIDHVWSVTPVAKGWGIPAVIHAEDRYRLVDPIGTTVSLSREQIASMTDGQLDLTEPDDIVVMDGTDIALDLAGLSFTVRHAPGHTEGSVVFELPATEAVPPTMLSGDVLFAGAIGRTDLAGGDPAAMLRSLARITADAPGEMVVYPGHGPTTTMAVERASNPYLQPAFLAGEATWGM